MIGSFVFLRDENQYLAATSYTNAKEFYESTGLQGESYHADVSNGSFYLGTKAKLASSSTNLKYYTVGYDITLIGNGASVKFSVKRGNSMELISEINELGYNYLLYQIPTETLYQLAVKADKKKADTVLESSVITVIANAIMTTKKGTNLNGNVTEDGFGGLHEWGTIYHLKNDSEWKEMRKIFSGHAFKSYRNIEEELENYQLSVRYIINGTEEANKNSSSIATVGNGYTQKSITVNGEVTQYVLHKKNVPVVTSARIVNQIQFLNPNDIDLKKKGYHFDSGKEWIYNHQVFSCFDSYMPKEISSELGYSNKNIYLYANWQPNTYIVSYHGNGTSGTLPNSHFTYDVEETLRNNTFSKSGYHLKAGAEWNTKADGSGTSYSSGQSVKNLCSENEETITLYANWEADIYEIATNKQGGTGGTNRFFEKYAVNWYQEKNLQTIIHSIVTPSKIGYVFLGYYENIYGMGTPIIKADGALNVKADYFQADDMLYASYEAKQYTVTFDKQEGIGGTDNVTATYGKRLPEAIAPLRNGFTFLGYYLDKACEKDRYYNQYMGSEKLYWIDDDSILYAKWKDDIPPIITIAPETEDWTNHKEGIRITVNAEDLGTGLESVEVYRGDTLVKTLTELNGAKESSFTINHTAEGVFRYRAVAVDKEGNRAEAYANCRYDTQAPQEITMDATNETWEQLENFGITVEITDYNIH